MLQRKSTVVQVNSRCPNPPNEMTSFGGFGSVDMGLLNAFCYTLIESKFSGLDNKLGKTTEIQLAPHCENKGGWLLTLHRI